MIVVLKQQISEKQRARVTSLLRARGYAVEEIAGHTKQLLAAIGNGELDQREIQSLEGVSSVISISQPFTLVSRATKSEDTIVTVGRVKIGGGRIAIIAGPYRIESREQITESAQVLREAGAVALHGGVYSEAIGEKKLALLQEAAQKYSLATICEVTNPADIPLVAQYVDMLQIGGQSMENEGLLFAVGATKMPVMLKRGRSSTIEEWLLAAEKIMQAGNESVVLCEQGIRTYERATRNTLDVSAIPVVQRLTHLPVIGDPSQATGRREMVAPMSLALIASGASGLMVEVQCTKDQGYSDGPQFLYPSQFEKLMRDLQALSQVVGKSLERIPRITLPTKSKAEGIASSVESE
ncbi:MAG TPA: 3-deoxy-7-phosphoheptulonate synthase, partial [Sphaerochaeta sp.]|nr:3-deoxy-7-phosphoheptulonate synthase [Sphaerochaeta sp.]